ncbi:hypothetical protein [Streptomyces albofaciens]|uniref:hypothetical protein n=1 Tax=Streptomyces albofaciens TaxID=66866 RepID=UPI001FCB3A7C|nr:hypothetical protein [Streptomyces albofaciens]
MIHVAVVHVGEFVEDHGAEALGVGAAPRQEARVQADGVPSGTAVDGGPGRHPGRVDTEAQGRADSGALVQRGQLRAQRAVGVDLADRHGAAPTVAYRGQEPVHQRGQDEQRQGREQSRVGPFGVFREAL